MAKRRYYKRRRYKRDVDPDKAHDRAVKAALARTGPDYFIRKLGALAGTLTDDHRRQIAELLAEPAEPAENEVA